MGDQIIKFPFGPASEEVLSAAGDQDIAIVNTLTVIDGVSTPATADRTLNLTPDENLEVGARVFIKTKTDAVENTIFGTNMQGTTYAGVAGKTKVVEAVYDGTNFVEAGTPVQID